MAKAPKKILNDPRQVVAEMIEGLVLANDGRLAKLPGRPCWGGASLPYMAHGWNAFESLSSMRR